MRARLNLALLLAVIVPSTSAAQTGAWRSLFDGKSTAGWRGYRSPKAPVGWQVESGALTKRAKADDIVSVDQFGDFELQIEWKIGEGGNSGLFYRGTEEYEHIYWSAPEYQLLDDAKAEDNKTRYTCAGAVYGLFPSPDGHLKPVGEWNLTRVVAKGALVEHWLNGVKLFQYELWTPDWEAKVKASKFGKRPNYGRARKGYLALQGDHDGTFAVRSVRIRELR